MNAASPRPTPGRHTSKRDRAAGQEALGEQTVVLPSEPGQFGGAEPLGGESDSAARDQFDDEYGPL